ncbi:hypothetical protein D1646_22235, partial [Pseudoflavonifractor sp. 60]|uniref:hypothetical protein n=1 Tax=Pseudoflavonifractor sp. 60 TaxID=2304576 RepID=UPI00157E7287
TVWPCGVTLYCGYAYESALIAQSFQTAVPAALAFAAGTLLLVFLASRLTGRRRKAVGLLAGAQGVAVAVWIVAQATEQLTFFLILALPAISLAGLAAALTCGVLEWKQSWFFRIFCLLTAAGAIAWTVLGRWQFSRDILE